MNTRTSLTRIAIYMGASMGFLGADQAAVIVIVPANREPTLVGHQLQLNGITINYRAGRGSPN